VRVIAVITSTVVSRKYAHPRKYAHSPFLLQDIAKGHLLLKSTPTQPTKTSSMHNDEICSVCVGLLYLVLCVHDNKQTHLSSSS